VPDDQGNRWLAEGAGRAATYDQRWAELAAAGRSVHGEADLVWSLLCAQGAARAPGPARVLDAGCGTGRVAAELARRGVDVVGVDLDAAMLAVARTRWPTLAWVEGDVATVDLGRRFDAVVLAGNVMIFLAPGTEGTVVANLARHLRPGGALVAGFQLQPGRLALDAYDGHAAAAGLTLESRWATWDREQFGGGDYAVSVHRADRVCS
jgi:SAM-dependent methyltransferase